MPSLGTILRVFCSASVLLATTDSTARSQEVLLQISDSAAFDKPTQVEIKEALLFDSLSVFIGKTGMIRNRGGMVAGVVVLSTQQLGCGRFQRASPAMLVVGEKRAKEFDERIAVTRPQPFEPPVSFSAGGPEEFEIWALARFWFDPKEMEEDTAYRPSTYRFLEGLLAPSEAWSITPGERARPAFGFSAGMGGFSFVVQEAGSVELRPREFDVALLYDGAPAGGKEVRFKADLKKLERTSPVLGIYRSDSALRAVLDVKHKQFSVQADVELRKCPALEHIHIEPEQ